MIANDELKGCWILAHRHWITMGVAAMKLGVIIL
jgi:hypothetical protein